jgi:ribosome biogenesis GTPase
VRESDLKGRHTTTNRHLVSVPGGGVLLDTPGLRSMGLWEVDDGLFRAFRDMEDLAAECRFSSCSHTSEPGCAVRAGIEAGDVDPDRVVSWQKLNEEFDALVAPEAQAARQRSRPRPR